MVEDQAKVAILFVVVFCFLYLVKKKIDTKVIQIYYYLFSFNVVDVFLNI